MLGYLLWTMANVFFAIATALSTSPKTASDFAIAMIYAGVWALGILGVYLSSDEDS